MQLADDPALDASFFTGSSPHEQPRRLSGRSLVAGLGVPAAGVAATAGLAVAAPHGGGTGGPAVWAALTVAYALASCVMFNVGNAWGIATQIVFVPMLAVLPPPVVPLAVIAATF